MPERDDHAAPEHTAELAEPAIGDDAPGMAAAYTPNVYQP